jgi:hypothetical protein
MAIAGGTCWLQPGAGECSSGTEMSSCPRCSRAPAMPLRHCWLTRLNKIWAELLEPRPHASPRRTVPGLARPRLARPRQATPGPTPPCRDEPCLAYLGHGLRNSSARRPCSTLRRPDQAPQMAAGALFGGGCYLISSPSCRSTSTSAARSAWCRRSTGSRFRSRALSTATPITTRS